MSSEVKQSSLAWTGERYLPEIAGSIELEHVHRYSAVLGLATGKRVLDIASGEGYGSDMLSKVAHHVIGVDVSAETIQHAQTTYQRPNLEYRLGSAAQIPIESNSIELVVSFETIEHHDQHDAMLLEIKRVLTADGVLVISSPNKRNYSIIPNYSNPYHVKELFTSEFVTLLKNHFLNVKLLGQRVVYGSLLVAQEDETSFVSLTKEGNSNGLAHPRYDFAVATNAMMSPYSNSLFEIPMNKVDAATYLEEQMAQHKQRFMDYKKETFALNNTIMEQNEKLNQELAQNAALHAELEKIHTEASTIHTEAQKILIEKDRIHVEAQKIRVEKDRLHVELQKMQVEHDQLNAACHQNTMSYNEQIIKLNQEIAHLNQMIINVTCSTSWYLTKPLRFISCHMRRLFVFFKWRSPC